MGKDEVIGVLDRQRRHELARLKGLDQLARQYRGTPLVSLLVEAATLHTQADLALLDRAETRAAALAASTITPALDVGSAEAAAPDIAAG